MQNRNTENEELLETAKQHLEKAKSSNKKQEVIIELSLCKSFLHAMCLEEHEYRDNSDIDDIRKILSMSGSRVSLLKERIEALVID